MASGSEVEIALKARELLAAERVGVRVVSMPCHELFAQQTAEYRDSVLPKGVRRVAIEAAHPMSWYRWVGADGVDPRPRPLRCVRAVPETLRGIRPHGRASRGERPDADRSRLMRRVRTHARRRKAGQTVVVVSIRPSRRSAGSRHAVTATTTSVGDAAEHHARHRAEQFRRHARLERADFVRRSDEDRVHPRHAPEHVHRRPVLDERGADEDAHHVRRAAHAPARPPRAACSSRGRTR